MIRFEITKLFTKRNIAYFIIFSFICCYYIVSGISEYKIFLNSKKNFVEYEDIKVNQYNNYEFYGGFGVGVLFQPSPLIVFFNSKIIRPLKVDINTTEILEIKIPKKGRYLFKNRGLFNGFADFAALMGIIAFFFQGLGSFSTFRALLFYKERFHLVSALFSRLLLLTICSLPLYLLALGVPSLFGISLSGREITLYLLFVLYSHVVFAFFFFCGAAADIFFIKNKAKTRKIAAFLFFFLLVIIPEVSNTVVSDKVKDIHSLENVNIKKFKNLMDFQDKAVKEIREKMKIPGIDAQKLKKDVAARFLDEVYRENQALEDRLYNETRDSADYEEAISVLLPTDYFSFLRSEVSSTGYYDYKRFFDYVLNTRLEFARFIISKRNFRKREKVEKFFHSADENVFQGRGFFPVSAWLSMGLLLLAGAFLFMLTFSKLDSLLDDGGKITFKEKGVYEFHKIREGAFCYVFFGNSPDRDRWFHILKGEDNIHMDQIYIGDFDKEMSITDYMDFHAYIYNTNRKQADFYLNFLGIRGDVLDKTIGEVDFEAFKKVYCAMTLARSFKHVVINDFTRGSGYDFKDDFRDLLLSINKKEKKTILYLAKEMFKTAGEHAQEQQINDSSKYKIFVIDSIQRIVI